MNIRRPAAAGRFYSGNPRVLTEEVKRFLQSSIPRQKAIGVVSPHAGYSCSGHVAGMVFARVEIPQKVIILGTNHTGYGAEASIMDHGSWDMPMGAVKIDELLSHSILEHSDIVQSDSLAQMNEHSVEVQVPFLQYLQPDLQIVPIVLGLHDFSVCKSVAQGIVKAIQNRSEDILMVASTDLTHYEPQSIAEKKDNRIIEKIKQMDAKGLLDLVIRERITMCGVMPVTTMLLAAKEMGAKGAHLVKYTTSGEVTGDFDRVVGYAGMIVE